MNPALFHDPAAKAYQQARIDHWNAIARKRDSWQGMGGWYHQRLHEIYRFHVSPDQNVLEVGCAEGHLLASLKPARLCGTNVLWRQDYERIAANRSYFGDFDPFGDYDLIFGAAELNRKIIDLPICYRERTYGSTNISRWKHGWLLLRMVAFAAQRIKFV